MKIIRKTQATEIFINFICFSPQYLQLKYVFFAMIMAGPCLWLPITVVVGFTQNQSSAKVDAVQHCKKVFFLPIMLTVQMSCKDIRSKVTCKSYSAQRRAGVKALGF